MAELNEAQFVAILNAMQSHAEASGWFDKVNGHEPKNTPGYRLTAAHWIQAIDPLPAASGLDATTGRLTWNVRVYQNFRSEPLDAIDPHVAGAVNALMIAYSRDFTLSGLVRNVDL